METLGATREDMATEHRRQMDMLINANSRKENYYVLVYCYNNLFTEHIHEKYITMSQKPVRMLGTMLYYVDNKKGMLKRIWCLPLDRTNVIPDAILDKEEVVAIRELTDERIIE